MWVERAQEPSGKQRKTSILGPFLTQNEFFYESNQSHNRNLLPD
jgi:hypothetical protein